MQDKPGRRAAGILIATALIAVGVVAAADLLRLALDKAERRQKAEISQIAEPAVQRSQQGQRLLPSATAVEYNLDLEATASDETTQLAEIVEHNTVEELNAFFAEIEFYISQVREGDSAVPRLYVTGLPKDLATVDQVKDRKQAFLRTLLPLVLLANEEINTRRVRLLALTKQLRAGAKVSAADRGWLDALAEYYGADYGDLDDLALRVDEIPVSLALAQGIVESGWGTSRFAQQGNALFGQRVWKSEEAGLVPEEASGVKVRVFGDLMESVRSYMYNLNTHPAYAGLRAARAAWRDQGSKVGGGYSLAGTLTLYAEATDYPKKLRKLMQSNKLAELESARLESGLVAQSASTSLIGSDS
tara:strand:- start:47 stop:1126 length:1080 start_codon:yes stop_codon:yes gene_type:complete